MTRTAILFTMLLLLASQGFSQFAHGNRTHYAEYGPNGKYIALAGDDLLLLNRRNEEIRVVNATNPEAVSIAFSQDGRYLAAESRTFGIYIYDLKNPSTPAIFFQGLKKRVGLQSRLKFNADNTMLITSNSSKVTIYDLSADNEGKVLLNIPNDPSNAMRSQAAFDITPDWKTIFYNMQVIALTKEKGKLTFKYGKKMNWDRVVTSHSVISPDGKKAVVTGRKGIEQRIYSLKTGDALYTNTSLKTYALAANKDFTKIYMNQAVWNLETQKIQVIYQARSIDKNTKTHISVAPDNGDFLVGLYEYNVLGKFKKTLQHKLSTFNRVSFEGKEVLFYRDYSNGSRYDLHAANIEEGLRGRSNRNLINKGRINTSLAASKDKTYAINHLSRIISQSSMTVSAPLFSLKSSKGLAADISKNNLIALANQKQIYLTELVAGTTNLNKRKQLKPIALPNRVNSSSKLRIRVSPNNQFIAVSYIKEKLDDSYGEVDTLVHIFHVSGILLKTAKTRDVNALVFSNDSSRLYYSSGKRLNCMTLVLVDKKFNWALDDTYSFYAESGRILAIALSNDDNMIGIASSNGYNKVVHAKYGNNIITCIMLDTDRLKVIKN